RQRGDKSAQEYNIDPKLLRREYDEHLLQRTVSISRTSASNIVNDSVKQYTSDTIQQIRNSTVGLTVTATLPDSERILQYSEGLSISPFSAARTPPIDPGSGSSSPTLSPPHRPLFNVNNDDNEQKEDEVVEGGAASNVFDNHKKASADDEAEEDEEFDGRPPSNVFDEPVAAAGTGDMSWIQRRPAFIFSLPLTNEWGPRVTESYNEIKKKTSLNYKQVDEIALLSGVLHFDETHVGFEAAEMSAITNEVLRRFYTKDLQEKDLKRSVEAAKLWSTWVQKWGSMNLLSCLSKELGDVDEADADTGPVVDMIMESYNTCQQIDILPVLFVALYVFRHYDTWSKLESESDAMSSVIVPILREFMDVQGHIRFKCLNTASAAGENRKAALDQDGQARQPDIVGRTNEDHEAYYGELKGMHPSTQSKNADSLRLAIFTKDSLDGLRRFLHEDLPLLSFRSVGPDVAFFLGAKIANTVVHARISNLTMPTCLSELRMLDQMFFFRMFQIRSLVLITSKRLKHRRQKPMEDHNAFPTLVTPHRNMALGIQSKAKLIKRKGKGTVEMKEAKRKKETFNLIGDNRAQVLPEALNSNQTLTTLYLWSNSIESSEALALSEALKTNQTLTTVEMRLNLFNNIGAQPLSEALKINSTLTTLELRSNKIADIGAQALSEALMTNSTLTTLD
ncbi:hypothetical protein BGZ92_006066, partial [Podila epicladia]